MIATNAFKQAVVGTYTTSDTVIELDSISDTVGNADYLPDGGFNLILYDGLFGNPADANNAGDYEILACTGVNYATNEITVTRAQEDTTAVTIGAGSWQVVYGATKAFFDQFEGADATILKEADIINDLTTGGVEEPLSAEQGKELKTQLDAKGKVLQVVRATDTTLRSTTSTSFVDVTGMTVTITPKKVDSTILVISSMQARANRVSSDFNLIGIRITNASNSPISGAEQQTIRGDSTSTIRLPAVLIGRDAPETISAVTYKTQFRSEFSGTTAVFENTETTGQMYAIEIES